jgi:hypothetical protein
VVLSSVFSNSSQELADSAFISTAVMNTLSASLW